MGLFKGLKAPKAAISLSIDRDSFVLGEAILGNLAVTSEEDFEVEEIRVELEGIEKLRVRGETIPSDNSETAETRIYSSGRSYSQINDIMKFPMYKGKATASEKLRITKGFSQQFPFKIAIPASLGPTFQGMRRDGLWLERIWTVKGIVAAKGRPDIETKRDIQVVGAAAPGVAASPTPGAAQAGPVAAPGPVPTRTMITSCTKCSAPISPNQEDLIVTCRYCGFTISLATQGEIRRHSMLENRLLTQQAVEAAQKYMDKGILRTGVAKDAQITAAKLRYIPFWVFSVNTTTSFSGLQGAGFMGELRQAKEAITDKKASALSKFGKIAMAGASAYLESRQRDQKPVTVSSSFSSHYVWPILARKAMIREISYYDVPAARKIPFDAGRISSDAEFLNTELNEDEARAKVRTEVEAKERTIASGKVDTLQSCNPSVTVGEGELVHAPIWFVQYALKGDNYVILVDGCEGKVLGGGRPLFKIT